MLEIRKCTTKEEYEWIVEQMENNSGIKEVFKYNIDRLKSSSIATIVAYNGLPIGFIYIAHELSDERIGFIDMGIVSNKRGYGFGKAALDIFIYKTRNSNMFFVAETKDDNYVAKRILSNYQHIYDKDNLCFYLVNNSIEKFEEEGLYDKLVDHLNSERISSKDLVKKLYK